MNPKSSTLFHFTKNISAVKGILLDGFWPRYCLDDFGWYSQKVKSLAFSMVCFCDIPLSRIDEHVKFYGYYGIGVTKEWAIRNSLNPVLYVSESAAISTSLKNISKPSDFVHIKKQKFFGEHFMTIMSQIKPILGKVSVGGKDIQKEFYQESEWRMLAHHELVPQWLTERTFKNDSERENYNSFAIDYCTAKLTPNDIRYIFVKNDESISNIVGFIQRKLGHFPADDLDVLVS